MKISIIIPVYNGGQYIRDTVKRIQNSTFGNLEIILIDDGSNDNSLEVINKLSEEDDRIVVIHRDNGGIYVARQTGIEKSTGDYICFCDQDDYVDADMYAKLIQNSDNGTNDLVICGTYKLIDDKKIPYDILTESYIASQKEKQNLIENILFREFKGYISNSCMISTAIWKCMIKRNLIFDNDIKFRSYVSFEDDFLFILDVITHAGKIKTIPDLLYGWYVNPNSESHTVTHRYIDDYVSKYNLKRDDIIRMLKYSEISEDIIYLYKQLAYCNMSNEYLQNECAACNRKITAEEVRRNLFVNDYINLAKGAKKYRNIFFKNKLIMLMLRKNMPGLAISFQRAYLGFKESRFINRIWNKVCK